MKLWATVSASVAILVVGLLLPVTAERRDQSMRQVTIVARDMAFYIEGSSTPNPTIRVKAGEQVLITFRNDEPGMTHDFAISAWNVSTRAIKGGGAADRLIITAPTRPGRSEYTCRPHPVMMRGAVIVE